MRIKRSSLKVCAMVFGAVFSLFICSGLVGCKTNTETEYVNNYVYVYPLQPTDPICGTWKTSYDSTFDIYSNFYGDANVSNCKKVNEENENTKLYIDWYNNKVILDKTDSNPVYVVYNDKSMKSGILLFKAKYSAYGSPTVGCYYGIKFEIKEANKAWFEGGYNNNLNNISDLSEACLKLAFDNTDYYSAENWTEAASGVTKQ